MSSRSDKQVLEDILEAIRRARVYVANLDYQQFLEDIRTQDAVIRSLEVMGEATKRVSSPVKAQYPDLPWKNMAGVRDKLIHDYFGVNLDIVWNIVTTELPTLAPHIEAMLADDTVEP